MCCFCLDFAYVDNRIPPLFFMVIVFCLYSLSLEFVAPSFHHMCKTIYVKKHIKVAHVKAYLSISYIHGFGPKY